MEQRSQRSKLTSILIAGLKMPRAYRSGLHPRKDPTARKDSRRSPLTLRQSFLGRMHTMFVRPTMALMRKCLYALGTPGETHLMGLRRKKEALCGTPGPGTYDVTTAVEARDKKKGRPKFGRSDRVTATDLVMIEAEGTPGPGKYTSELTWDRSLSIPHADRDRDSSLAKHLQEAKDTPSPFDYQSNTPEKNAKQGYSFPKHEAQSCLDGLISHANDVPGVGSYTLDDPREWLKCGGKFGQQVVRDDEMERLKAKHATPSPAEYQSLSHEHYSFARSQRVHAKKSDGETVLCNWYPPNDLSCVKVVNKVHVVEQEGSAFSDDDLHRQLISRLVSRPLASALGATAPGPASSVDLIDLVYEDGIGDLNVSVGGLDRTRSGADSSGHQGEPVSRELTTSMSVNTEKRGGSARSAGDGDADESNKQGNSTIRSVAFERAQSIRARPGSRPGARPPLPAPSPSPSSSGSQFAEPDAGTSAGPPHDHLKQNQAGTQPSSLHGPASSQGRRSSVSRDRRGSVTRDSQSHRYGKQGSDNPHEKVLTHEKHAAPPRTAGKPGAPSQSARAQKAALICDDAETARVKFAKKRRLAKEYYQTIENVKKLLESHEIDTYDLKTSVPPPDDEVAWALAEAQDQALIDFLQTVHECMLTQPPAELDPVDGDVANKIDSLPQHNNRGKRARERDEEMSVSRVLQKKPARGTKWREGVLAHDRELVAAPNATGPVYRFGGRIMVSDFYSGGVPHPRLPSRRVPDAFIHDKHPPLNDVVTDIKVKEMEKLEKQAEQEALEKQRAMLLDELKDGSGVEKLIESQIAHALRQQTKNERESAQATRERIRARVNELLCMVRLGRIPKSFVLQVLDHYARIDTWQRLHTSKGEAQLALVPDRTSYEAQPYHKHVSNMYRTNHAFRRSNQRCQDAIARARDFDVATIFRPSTAPGGRPRPRSPSPVRVLPRSHPHPEKKSSDRPLPQPKTPQSTPAARPASPPPCEPCGPQPQLAPSKARRHSHPGHGADVVGHGNAAALSAGGHAHAGTRTAAAEEHIAGSGAGMGASTSLSTLKYDTLASQNTSLTRGRPKSASARPAPHSQPTIGSRNKPREHVRSRRGSCRTDDDDTHVRSDDAEEEFESDSTIQNYTCDVDGGGGEGLATNVTPGRGVGTKSPHGPSRAASLPRNTSIPTEHVHKPVAKADSMVSKQTPTSHRDTSPGAGASLRCRESVPPTTLVPSKDDPTTDVSRHPGSPDPAGNHLSNRADHHHHHRHHQTGTRPTSAFRRSPKRTGGSPKEGPQSGPKVAGPGDVLLGSPGLTFRITEPSVSSVESLASMSSLGLMPHPNAPWQRQASQCAETVSLSSPSNENRAPHGVAEDATAVVAHSGGHPEADLTVDDFDDEVARIQQKREGEDEAIRFRRESRKGLVHDGQLDTPEGGSAAECSSPEQRMVRIRRMRKAGLPFSVAPIDFQKLVAKEFPETRSPTIANGTHSRQNTSPTRRATKEPTTELRGVESAWSVVADDHSTSSCALPARLVPPPLRQSLPLDLSSVAGGSSPVSRVAPGVRGGNAGTSASHHSP
eukprot:Rmarinus@m.25627